MQKREPNHRLRAARERAHLSRELGLDHAGRATPDDVDRKAFLQAALGAGAGGLVARRFPDHDATDLVAAVAGPTAHYGRLGDSVSPVELSPAVEAHLRLAMSVVHGVLPTRDGYAVLSEAAVLAAWMARERDDPGTARRHYGEAVGCAERADYLPLTAFMRQSRGTFAVEHGDPQRGLALLQQARQDLEGTDAPDAARAHVASWLALAHAELGDRQAALGELRGAESLIDSNRGEPVWPWVLGFTAAKAARYQASAFAKLADLTAARSALAAAAPALASPRPFAQAQVDHARALTRAGQLDEARARAADALEVGRRYGFERIVQQVRALNLMDVDNC
jgi:tetratricopeptide (TPR) repeat protein